MVLALTYFVLLDVTVQAAAAKERLKVKYKIRKSNRNNEVEKQKIDEVLMKVDPEDANSETEDNINDLNSMDVNTAFETPDFSAFGLNDESFAPVKKYRDVVVGLMGQLQRTARAQDLSIGDLVFDIVKEVISETLSGLFSRGLGLQTARNGGSEPFSIVNTVIQAVSKVASGKSC